MYIMAKQLRNGGKDTGGFTVVYRQNGKRVDLNCSVKKLTGCTWWVRQLIEEPITENLSAVKFLLKKTGEKECIIATEERGCKKCLLGAR